MENVLTIGTRAQPLAMRWIRCIHRSPRWWGNRSGDTCRKLIWVPQAYTFYNFDRSPCWLFGMLFQDSDAVLFVVWLLLTPSVGISNVWCGHWAWSIQQELYILLAYIVLTTFNSDILCRKKPELNRGWRLYYIHTQEKINREITREIKSHAISSRNPMSWHGWILEGPITSRRHFFSTSSPRLDQQQHFQTKTQ